METNPDEIIKKNPASWKVEGQNEAPGYFSAYMLYRLYYRNGDSSSSQKWYEIAKGFRTVKLPE